MPKREIVNVGPHIIYAENENGDETATVLAYIAPAKPAAVQMVLNAKVGDLDGRSKYCWIRLQDGSLILGVFPLGDTYIKAADGDANSIEDRCHAAQKEDGDE